MSGVGSATDGLKVKNSIPLPGNSVPTGAFAEFRVVIAPPLGSFAYGLARSPVPTPGGFQFPGAAGQAPTVAESQKFRNEAPTVNFPSKFNVPVMGIAIAGADTIIKAAHNKPNNKSLFRLFFIVLSPPR